MRSDGKRHQGDWGQAARRTWWHRVGSNHRHSGYEPLALPLSYGAALQDMIAKMRARDKRERKSAASGTAHRGAGSAETLAPDCDGREVRPGQCHTIGSFVEGDLKAVAEGGHLGRELSCS